MVLAACASTEQQDTSLEPQQLETPQYTLADGAVPLQDFYATSVPASQQVSFIQALFDGDSTTFWRTKTGAGPNEGLMLYFSEPTYIATLQLKHAESTSAARLRHVQLYGNGKLTTSGNPNNYLAINKSVKSLFIRFADFEGTEAKLLEADAIGTNGNDAYTQIFPAQAYAAISELILTKKDGSRLQISPPILLPATVQASSELSPIPAYGAQQMFDGRTTTGWAEGKAEAGVGESINFSFQEPQKITGIQIANGFQRSKEHFYANARPLTLIVKADTQRFAILPRNELGWQQLNFPKPITASNFSLTVDRVQEGTKYADMVISEMLLTQGNVAIKPVPDQQQLLEDDLLDKASSTVLSKVLDRNLNMGTELPEELYKRSFILRSDYSFVYYSSELLYNDDGSSVQDEKVADGNWEIKHLAGDSAVVRIFGKLASTSRQSELYVGNTESSQTRIFQDFITILPDRMYGQQFIDTLGIYE